MRFFGIIFLALTMCASWNWVKTANDHKWQTHVQIQIEMEELIHATIAKHRPQAKNLRVHQVWTQTMKNKKIKVFFNYSFKESSEDEDTDQSIRGYAILSQSAYSSPRSQSWSLDEVRAEDSQIFFHNGLTITPTARVQ